MARTYEVAFRISGALNGQFAAAMQAAQNAMRGLSTAAQQVNAAMAGSAGTLSRYLNSLNQMAAQSKKFADLKAAIPQTQSALTAELAKMGQLATAYRQQKAQVDAMRAAYQQLKAKQADLKKSYTDEQNKLRGLQALKQQYKRELAENEARPHNLEQIQKAVRLESQIKSTTAAIEQQRQKIREAKSVYDTLTSAMKGSSAELRAAESALKQLGSNFDSSKAKVTELMNTLRRQKSELAGLKSSLSAAGFSTDHFISSEMRLRSEIAATTAAIERQRQAAASLSAAQNNLNAASSNFSEAQSAFNSVQQAVDVVAAPIQKSVETAMTFEHAMSRVKALTQSQNIREGKTDVVEKEFAALEKQALDLGATTKFTAIQAAEAMSFLGLAGWKTNQILGTMPGMLDLAAAAGADLAQTADIVSDNMTAMGVPVKDAPHFMDVYAYALTNSNARLTDFGETMKYAAPVAKAFGSSLDETAAMVMMMANAGIKGSMAGTSLRMGLLRLAGPPKTATKEMEKLGLSLSDAQAGALEAQAVIEGLGIDLKGATSPAEKMTRVIMQLHEKTKNLSQDEKLAAFKGIFGVNAETGWLALFDQGPDVFLKYVEGLRNADGYARQVATTMMDDTQGAITILKSAMESAYLAVGKALNPAIRAAAEAVTPLISAFTQWANANPRVVQGIVGIIAALSALALAVTGVAVAFAAWSFITAQFAMFQAGLAAVRAGMIATEVASLGMAGRIGAAFATIQATLAGLTFSGIAASVSAAFTKIGAAIMTAARASLAFIATPLGLFLTALAAAAYVIYENWDRIAPAISQVGAAISSALDAASQAVSGLMTALGPIGDAISQAFGDILGIWEIEGFTDGIVAAFLGIVNIVAGVGVSIINIFTATVQTVTALIEGLKDTFSGLGEFISAVLTFDFDKMGDSAILLQSKIDKAWRGIDFEKADFGYDISGNFRQQYAAYKRAPITQPFQSAAENQGALSNAAALFQPAQPAQPAAPAPMPTPTPAETPNLDTSSFTAQMQALGAAAEQPAQTLPQIGQGAEQVNQSLTNFSTAVQPAQESIAQLPQAIQPVQDALANFPAAIEPATTALQNVATTIEPVNAGLTALTSAVTAETTAVTAHTAALTANTAQVTASTSALQAFIAALQATLGALQAFTAALQATISGLTALASASSSAATSVASLGSAASSAASAMSSAASSIASAASSAASAAASASAAAASAGASKPAANYKGGIYNKGAFLTWFAERSPEAAIPLDKSARAINLWTQAGQMLGVLPSDSPVNTTAEKIPRDNTQRAILTFQKSKEIKARKIYNSVVNQSATENYNTSAVQNTALSNVTSTVERISNVQRRVQNLQAAQFDELGNIIGLNGAAGNVITQYDSEQVKHVKQELQLKEFAEKQDGTSSLARYLDKFRNLISKVRETIQPASQPAEKIPAPTILFESQRWRSESPTREKTLDRVANSRSYQAIVNAQRQSVVNSHRNMTRQNTRTSILNAPAELQTTLPTDRYKNLNIGGFNLRDIPFVGDIFGKANDALRGIFGKQPVDIFSGIGKSVDYEIMHPRGTFPTLPAETQPQGNLPTDIFKNVGGVNLDNVPIIGGLIGKANDALRGIFGKQPVDVISDITGGAKAQASYDIMHPTGTFPTLQSNSAPMLDRIQNLQSSVTDNRLEDVKTYEGGTSNDYSAAAFQPTFNITVTITGSGEQVDTKKIGEQIAYSACESFERKYNNFMREKSRRGFA